MKTLSEICVLVKKEYQLGRPSFSGMKQHPGMCSAIDVAVGLRKLTEDDRGFFFAEYQASIKNQKVFYSIMGGATIDNEQFAWHPSNKQSRIDWLNERI